MTGSRLGTSLGAGFACCLLALSVQAGPRGDIKADSGLTLRLAMPELLAQAPAQPSPSPYYAPQPGAYPPPAYAPQPYAQPYYPPLDTRPPYVDYDSDKPIPPGYTLESSAHRGFVVAGAIIFGISYTIALAVAGGSEESTEYYGSSGTSYSSSEGVPFNSKLLYIPVVGPWLALGSVHDFHCSGVSSYSAADDCEYDSQDASAWKSMLALGAATQTLGAGFIALGLLWRSHRLVLTEQVRASVVPVRMGNSGQGLAMVGSFGGL